MLHGRWQGNGRVDLGFAEGRMFRFGWVVAMVAPHAADGSSTASSAIAPLLSPSSSGCRAPTTQPLHLALEYLRS